MSDKKLVRVWQKDGSYKSFAVPPEMTAKELIMKVAERIGGIEEFADRFALIERKGKEPPRMLDDDEKPYDIKLAWEEEGYNVETGYYKILFRMKTDSELQESKKLENRYMLRAGANVLEAPEVASAAQQMELMEKAEKAKTERADVKAVSDAKAEERAGDRSETKPTEFPEMWAVVERLEALAMS